MRVRWGAFGLAVGGIALALGGCASTGSPGPVVAAVEAPPPPQPVNYGAFLGGAAGSKLPEADRTVALAAETDALQSGQRKSWKGAKGVYGFVEPGPAEVAAAAAPAADGAPAASCRSFTSTIFFGGRPQTGHGTGCQGADGSWHLTS